MQVAVVGAGVMGLAAARALAQSGAQVTIYEQFRVGHARGSSHGDARIFRLAYPEAQYAALARESLPLWRELEHESGVELLRTTGSLDIGHDLPHAAALDELGLAYERLEPVELEARFGISTFDQPAIYQPDGGVLHAERAQRAFLAGAVAAGAELREDVRVEDLEAVDGDVVVVTAGSWVNRFGFELPVRVTRETVAYFDVDRATPAIIEWEPGGFVTYALTTFAGLLKIGSHHAGAEADPDETGDPDPAVVDACRASVELWFDRALEPARVETCLYTTTPDESFVLERRGRYVIGSPCSGHGFKFAPAIGRRLAYLALGV